jgi:hypothetical protein
VSPAEFAHLLDRDSAPVADPFAPVQRRPAADESFPITPASAAAPASAPARPKARRAPLTPYKGFRRPSGPKGPKGPPWLAMTAGALALMVVLGGVFVGLNKLNGPPGPLIGADTGPTQPYGALQPGESPEPGATPAESAAPSATKAAKGAITGPRTGAEKNVKLGVFLGTSPSGVREFGDWLGRKPDYAIDFSARTTWDDIANPAYTINTWQGSRYRMVYSVALLPWNGNTTMKAGAKGEYDQYFRTLARNLVAGGQEDAILRLGWEFNLKGWKWSTDNPKDFIGYWRHIVTAMRSVPGEKFEFDWNPNIGETPYEADLYYPGNKYVDYVGVDVYDVSWTKDTYPYPADCNASCRQFRQEDVWDRLLNGHFGLAFWSDFARSKGKPMSLPEWGMWDRPDGHGGADNPYFIKQMHAFIDDPDNRVAYQGYLQVDVADGQHKLTTLKTAGKMYQKLFGK